MLFDVHSHFLPRESRGYANAISASLDTPSTARNGHRRPGESTDRAAESRNSASQQTFRHTFRRTTVHREGGRGTIAR
jgi:hypothetical protein